MNNLFTIKTYIQKMIMMGSGEPPPKNTMVKVYDFESRLFSGIHKTENKPDCVYIGSRSKLNGTKETQGRERQGIGSMDNSNVGPRS